MPEDPNKYSNDDNAKKLFAVNPYGNVTLKKVIVVFYGWVLAYCEEYI